jgi:16S rRNA (cytosine967-C5)-methyltransferase
MLSDRKQQSQARAITGAVTFLLRTVLSERRPADRALAALLREHHEFGSRDRRMISEMAYAVLRWWGWLQRIAPAAMAETDDFGPVLAAACVAEGMHTAEAWQGFLQDRNVPQELISTLQMPDAAGRLEALFRAWQMPSNEPMQKTELIPGWVLAESVPPHGWPELIDWLQKRPPLWARIQAPDTAAVLAELTAAGLQPQASAHIPGAVQITSAAKNLHTLPVYREGRVEIQDISSQAIGQICAPKPGQHWWDACAGGGGKALLLASLMRNQGRVTASDIRGRKLDELSLRARRGDVRSITTFEWDGRSLPEKQAAFDGVLVDAPCTGSGTWRRNPGARWSLQSQDVEAITVVQRDLLANAGGGVKPGGTLVYATCSLFRRENEGVVEGFLARHAEFALAPFAHPFTGDMTTGLCTFWPWDGDGDAMFVARLVRKS